MISNENGFTIVEMIVSFLIIAIMAACIIPSLIFGFKQVYDSGNKSEKIYSVQEEIESELVTGSASEPKTIEIQFGDLTFTVEGSIIEKEEVYDTQGDKAKAKVFIPEQ
jgi:competence protein ComGC